jgi:hypothetical protein
MKNYFLKTFALSFFLLLGLVSFAQDYETPELAIERLKEKRAEVIEIIINQENDKTMSYFKAVASQKIIDAMLGDFKEGKSVEEVAIENSATMKMNHVQIVKPMFPDSNGRYGTNWINEELLVLLEKK